MPGPSAVQVTPAHAFSGRLPLSFALCPLQVEGQQVALLQLLAGRHAPGLTGTSRSCALMAFMRNVLQRNRGCLRDVPPPGLSGVEGRPVPAPPVRAR